MGVTKNIEIKKWNGVDWDILHPKTDGQNVITPSGNDIDTDLGNTQSLNTTSKEIVSAINEVDAKADTKQDTITSSTDLSLSSVNATGDILGSSVSIGDYTITVVE